MNKHDDGGQAYPASVSAVPDGLYSSFDVSDASGMSLRDWFAGQALAGLLASGPHDCDEHGIAHDAYLHAAAMIAEKRRRDGGA